MRPEGEREYWLDRKENVTKVYWGVWGLCALLLLVEPLVHKHGDFSFENWFGFYSLFDFGFSIYSGRLFSIDRCRIINLSFVLGLLVELEQRIEERVVGRRLLLMS